MKYEFYCEKCKEKREYDIPLSDSSKKQYCEKCGSELRRVFSSFGLKTGDGFKKSKG